MKEKTNRGTGMDIVEKIKQIKHSRKITNEDLSLKSGIPLGTLNKLLSGSVAEPKLSTLLSICSVLNCRLSDLTGETLPSSDPLFEKFSQLDDHGKELVTLIIEKEYQRCRESAPAVTLTPVPQSRRAIILPLFDLPVSAGTGVYLDGDSSENIKIEMTDKTKDADFALRISGDSMMPKYQNGDVILVDSSVSPEPGELGIYICDGCGYFKKFGGDRLISLNPDYRDIPLSSFEDVVCKGRVIGRLK